MADSDSPAEARKSEGGPPRLARSAGVFGLATITSRILGLVREQVMAYYFGAGDANDAFRVASRIPNLVRDLFAEGAMSAAFVPTFTRQLTLEGRERSWRLASSVINALLIVTGVIVVLGIVFAEPLVRLFASDFSEVPGKIELTIYLDAHRVSVPDARRRRGGADGDAEFARPLLRAGAVAGDVQRRGDRDVADADSVRADRSAFSRSRSSRSRRSSAASASSRSSGRRSRKEGFRYRRSSICKDEGLHRVLLLMGPGTIGMAATQINVFVNTRAGDRRRHRRGVVARLRVSADVSADRTVRRLDRDGGHAGDLAHGRRAGLRAHSIDARPARSG